MTFFSEPCPSLVYQEHIKEYLSQDSEGATKLLDSLLNQLNWAFSEFVGMLQEVCLLGIILQLHGLGTVALSEGYQYITIILHPRPNPNYQLFKSENLYVYILNTKECIENIMALPIV